MTRPEGLSTKDPVRWAEKAMHLGVLITLVSMPWSKAGMSIGQFTLLGAWLLHNRSSGTLAQRLRQEFSNSSVLLFTSFWLLHVIGLVHTENLDWGIDLCRILLPAILFPVVLATAPSVPDQRFRSWFLYFALSVLLCAGYGYTVAPYAADHRMLSPFVNHIRMGLMVCMAAFVLVRYWPVRGAFRILHMIGLLWAAFYLQALSSFSNLIVVLTAACPALWRVAKRYPPAMCKALRTASVCVPMLLVAWPASMVLQRQEQAEQAAPLEEFSAGGERYVHDTLDQQIEGGGYIWRYVALEELGRGWERRSAVDLGGMDAKGHALYGTLVRYMTSKGLRKDSLGVARLTDADVRAIEQGVPTVLAEGAPLIRRMNELFFEMEHYLSTGNPSGHSLPMRLESARVALALVHGSWLFGVGTGDTAQTHSKMQEPWRHLRAHDQYLTWLLSFGVLGLVWCLSAWCLPAIWNRASREPLFTAWAIAFAVSCFSDDTLETQAGCTFGVVFYALFVFLPVRSSASTA
jgi:hypothetical protein